MAFNQSQAVKITLVAAADLSAAHGRFVKMVAGQAALITAATDRPIGVLCNKPKAGQEAEIFVLGTTKIVASAAMASGDSVAISADGRAAAAGTTAGTANLGTVLLANSAAGGFITAMINCVNQTR